MNLGGGRTRHAGDEGEGSEEKGEKFQILDRLGQGFVTDGGGGPINWTSRGSNISAQIW